MGQNLVVVVVVALVNEKHLRDREAQCDETDLGILVASWVWWRRRITLSPVDDGVDWYFIGKEVLAVVFKLLPMHVRLIRHARGMRGELDEFDGVEGCDPTGLGLNLWLRFK
jgi:hypothetical protein